MDTPYFKNSSLNSKFSGGEIIPSGAFIATSFGGRGQDEDYWKQSEFHLKPIAHYRSWGFFIAEQSFSFPTGEGIVGECMSVIPDS